MNPTVSIVTATFNKEHYISEAIQSLLSQTYYEIEILLIDDCSTDGTANIIREFSSHDRRINTIINSTNKGANFCRNQGLAAASGDYVLFMDADDILTRDCIEKRVEFLKTHPENDFAVFTMQIFDHVPGDRKFTWQPRSKSPLKDFLTHDLPWTIVQPLWKKSFLLKHGGFDESFKRLQDVELHTRILLANPKFQQVISEPDCFVRVHEARKNFNDFEFMSRWAQSAILYTSKFAALVPEKLAASLRKTIFQTYLQLLHYKITGRLSLPEFKLLESELFHTGLVLQKKSQIILQITRFYNFQVFRIPGLNRLLKMLI